MAKPNKKEIARIIESYIGNPGNEHLKQKVSSTIRWTGGFTLIDFLLTGGVTTAAFATYAAICGGLDTLSHLAHRSDLSKKVEQKNTAGQTIEAPKLVHMTLEKMEKRLSRAFARVTAVKVTDPQLKFELSINGLAADKNFVAAAVEVQSEIEKLSPTFNIVAGGKHGFGTADYKFIVETKSPSPGVTELVTIEQAMKLLQKQAGNAPETEEEKKELRELKSRLEALENPQPLNLDKKRPPARPSKGI